MGLVIGFIVFLLTIVLSIVLFSFLFKDRNPEEMKAKYAESSKSVLLKKYPEVDLRVFSSSFLLMGALLSIGITLFAFNYVSPPDDIAGLEDIMEMEDFEIEPPQTQQIKQPPPPPPPPEIEIVEDEEILEEEPEIEDIEVEMDEVVEAPEEFAEEVVEEPEIFDVVEDMPRFPGCEGESTKDAKELCAQRELLKYLAKVKYPDIARENDIEGKVFIRFVVDEKGKIASPEILRGADKLLNDAALKHVKNMPTWVPGKQRGKAVKVYYMVPFNFKLN